MLKSVVQLLEITSQAATKNLRSMTANEIRRLLACYEGLPLSKLMTSSMLLTSERARYVAAKFASNLPGRPVLLLPQHVALATSLTINRTMVALVLRHSAKDYGAYSCSRRMKTNQWETLRNLRKLLIF
jgi:hypothetical protein